MSLTKPITHQQLNVITYSVPTAFGKLLCTIAFYSIPNLLKIQPNNFAIGSSLKYIVGSWIGLNIDTVSSKSHCSLTLTRDLTSVVAMLPEIRARGGTFLDSLDDIVIDVELVLWYFFHGRMCVYFKIWFVTIQPQVFYLEANNHGQGDIVYLARVSVMYEVVFR